MAEEFGYEGVFWAQVDVVRAAGLFDAAVVHDDDLVGHFEGFFLVVGYKDAGDAELVVDVAQPGAQLFAHFGIERAEGFVQQQQFGFDGKGAGEGDALALATGELVGVGVGEAGQAHELQQFGHFGADLFFGRALGFGADGEAEGDVVGHGHVAEQGVVLEDEADFAFAHVFGGNVLAVEQNPAAVGVFEAGDDAQQGGFATAGGAEQGGEAAGGGGEGDVVQGVERAEVFADVFDGDAHGSFLCAAASLRAWILAMRCCTARVARASRASRPERAKAAVKLYSL